MKKINILVVPSDTVGGVGFYRSTQPHKKLEELYPDEFSVTFEVKPDFTNLSQFDKYDIIHIHKGLYSNMGAFYAFLNYCKAKNIVTVMDIDDHWKLDPHHPQYVSQRAYGLDKIVCGNFAKFDYVTTTTPLFAKEIKPYNKNVYVFPNAIDPNDERFQVTKPKSDRIRIGMIMGSSHEYDVQLLQGMTNKLPKEIIDKIQLVLCGFDLRGTVRIIDMKTKKSEERPLQPKECVWYRYEKLLTDNYNIIDEDYKNFLEMFVPNAEYPNVVNEPYRRCWTMDMNHYYQHYANVDVLLAPIEVRDFNKVKSQLKCIECCFSKTAIIASDFGPYQIDLVNMFEKGGNINENGNAILIDESKNHKDWAKAIKKLVENPELITKLQNNLYRDLNGKYNLDKVVSDRAEFYKKIVKKED